jgi:two-component system, chemotaxis family, protein-glutamate methylesterase/glutaminase
MALRTLEEKKALSQRMASPGLERRLPGTTRRYGMLADDAERAVDLIRDVIARLAERPGWRRLTPKSDDRRARRLG